MGEAGERSNGEGRNEDQGEEVRGEIGGKCRNARRALCASICNDKCR